ncbi:putative addiction module CopG family antidote [Rhizobium rosettiformans]|uniref:Type II toxin-antitoxin system ParD family antitoxin n=2 Tax=Rhizobium rosettiformans TaxID=1368430 RepID=A0A4S8PU68_9HYPH|nr:type II toxin-antitoxin system ParD family antitoxin [Rhizobium rosettiformans]MBB5277142.1 putative addiction module CopG family antidote [Rhizobium rosettiformans]THV34938.1 type II toxin-antitoxin system ParD family antitoxin [Rhizobium rosettiformans W3]
MKHDRIVLDDRQAALVERLVESGRFSSTTDVIGYSLDLLEQREAAAAQFLSELEDEAVRGLESGPAADMETAEELISMFRKRR